MLFVGRSKGSAIGFLQKKHQKKALELISRLMDKDNIFNLKKSDLSVKRNLLGKGFFVYAEKTRFSGVERYLIWYVNVGIAMSLNGPSITAAPNIPFPRELEEKLALIPINLWSETGLNESSVTEIGLSQVFGIDK